jgi:plasmid maintenance system antidote protein VapI
VSASRASAAEREAFAALVRGVATQRGDKARVAAALGLDPAAVSRAHGLSEHAASRVARALGESWALDVSLSESDRSAFLRSVAGERMNPHAEGSELGARIFARAIGVKPNSVWRYEQGESRPRPDTLARIAEVTGRSLEWLLVGEHAAASTRPIQPAPSAYDLVRRMDARELRAFRAWVLAWTDEGPDAA